jgi:hypothetical protein
MIPERVGRANLGHALLGDHDVEAVAQRVHDVAA